MLRPEDAEENNVSVFTEHWDLVMWLQEHQFQNWELEGGLLCQGFSFNRGGIYFFGENQKKKILTSHILKLKIDFMNWMLKSEPNKDIIFSLIHRLKMKPLQIQMMAISLLRLFSWMVALPERYLLTVQVSP